MAGTDATITSHLFSKEVPRGNDFRQCESASHKLKEPVYPIINLQSRLGQEVMNMEMQSEVPPVSLLYVDAPRKGGKELKIMSVISK